MNNPYKHCPVYKTGNFTLRLVSEEDANDLLVCYSDPKAQELFNIDGFPIDCKFTTPEEMLKYIKFWLMEYSQERYVRFAVVDKATTKAIGTVEMFGSENGTGILRIDLASDYEKEMFLDELLNVAIEHFYELFNVNCIATKAIGKAVERIQSFKRVGFEPKDWGGKSHYYLRSKNMNRKRYIENNVLCLAETINADNKILYESWNDHETIWGYNWKIPYSFDEYCTNFKNDNNSDRWRWGAVIVRLEDSAVIGRIGLSPGLPDLTITIFNAYRNQQYGTMAFLLGVRYCFEVLKLDKIYAGCFEDNVASRKIIEQCGFKRNPEGDDIEDHIFTGEDRLQLDFMITGSDYNVKKRC